MEADPLSTTFAALADPIWEESFDRLDDYLEELQNRGPATKQSKEGESKQGRRVSRRKPSA